MLNRKPPAFNYITVIVLNKAADKNINYITLCNRCTAEHRCPVNVALPLTTMLS